MDRSSKRKPFDIVAIAASAGGLQAISMVLSGLPKNFPVPVVIVQHLHPRFRSQMADILTKRTAMKVKQAEEGERLRKQTVYIAPPDHHLLVNKDGTISLTQTELVHFLRPSGDLLFESVAASHRNRAIGIVLSGTGSDGSLGVTAIKKLGGTVIVQDAATAEFSGMPEAAVQTKAVDYVLPLDEIAVKLIELVTTE